jgi:hypothetical protein
MSQECSWRHINNGAGSVGLPKGGFQRSSTGIADNRHIRRERIEEGIEGARSAPICFIYN